MTPLYEIRIRRDAHTVTPVTVPEYELPLLQEIFGAENVHNADRKRVDEAGCGTPAVLATRCCAGKIRCLRHLIRSA